MKKLRRALLVLCVLSAVFSAGCRGCKIDLNSNDRSLAAYYAPHSDGEYYYYNLNYDRPSSGGGRYIRLDKATGEVSFYVNEGDINGYLPGVPCEDTEPATWERSDGDITYMYEIPSAPVILDCKNNGWRGHVRVSEQNYGIYENLLQRYQTKGVSFIHAYLLDGGDAAYGFVNVYDHTTGMLFGAGEAGVSGISYGALIEYDIKTGDICEIIRVDGGCITAFDRDTVMFFRGEKYYSQNVGAQPVFWLSDLAYDRGATNYSFSFTLFNEEHFVLYMHSDNGRREVDYAYIFDSDGELISYCQMVL